MGQTLESLGRLILSRATREAWLAMNPGLQHGPRGPGEWPFLRLALYALTGDWWYTSDPDRAGEERTRKVINGKLCATFDGQLKRHSYGKHNAGEFLNAFAQHVWPEFQTTGWGWRFGKRYPRQIETVGIPKAEIDLLEADLVIPLSELPYPVFALSGDGVPVAKGGNSRRALLGKVRTPLLAEADTAQPLCDEQGVLLRYLNGRHSRLFTDLVKKNLPTAIQVVREYTEDPLDRIGDLFTLRSIQRDPVIIYGPSDGRGTVRVFPIHLSMIGLKSPTRRALMAGCYDLDLRSAHLAIAAAKWGMPSLQRFLEGGESIWPVLFEAVGRDHDTLCSTERAEYDRVKSALKEAVYASAYGMLKQIVTRRLRENLGREAGDGFRDHPFIQELFRARDAQLEDILRDRGAVDCFGRLHGFTDKDAVREKARARSILSCVSQSWELLLLYPAVEYAVEQDAGRRLFQVVAWQHDGFTIKTGADRMKRMRLLRELKRRVRRQGEKYGIPAELTVEYLEPSASTAPSGARAA